MQDFPHHYAATACGVATGNIRLRADGLPELPTASPAEFDGPGNQWSPETLLVGAVADCFVMTFRAVARASKVPWTSLECQANGTLDRIDRVTQFTRVDLQARLTVPYGTNPDLARRALEKAERNCLITSSLKAVTHLTLDVSIAAPDALLGISA